MKKVICINNKPKYGTPYDDSLSRLVEGDTYTVIGINNYVNVGYILKEVKSTHPSGSYCATRFIPLSEIDEMELINKRELIESN